MEYSVSVPANTTATLYVPMKSGANKEEILKAGEYKMKFKAEQLAQ